MKIAFFILLVAGLLTSCSDIIPEQELHKMSITDDKTKSSLKIIDDTICELKSKGWENVQVKEGHVDVHEFSNLIIVPTDKEMNMQINAVLGHTNGMYDNPITVIVEIAFDSEETDGKIHKILYVSEAGRDMTSDKILAADDAELYDVMYSY